MCNKFTKKKMTIHELFVNTCNKHPDKIMIYFKDEEWRFRDIEEFSNQVAHFFSGRGYKRGDSIAVFMDNKPQYVGLLLGLSKVGMIAALINTNLVMESLVHCVSVGNTKAIVFDHSLWQPVADVVGRLREANPSFATFVIDSPDRFGPAPAAHIGDTVDLDQALRRMNKLPLPRNILSAGSSTDTLCYIYTSG